MNKFNDLKNGTHILFKIEDIEYTGIVIGFSSEFPIVGKMYIVNTENIFSEVYPYQACIVPESFILKVIEVKEKIKPHWTDKKFECDMRYKDCEERGYCNGDC